MFFNYYTYCENNLFITTAEIHIYYTFYIMPFVYAIKLLLSCSYEVFY